MANINQYDAGRNIVIDRQHRLDKLQEAQKITFANLGAYAVIMTAELIIGYFNNITVLIADGLNNLTGVCGAAIIITGLKISRRPPDSNHVLGHWQYENIAAFLSATIMFAVSIQILVDGVFAVQRFLAGGSVRLTTGPWVSASPLQSSLQSWQNTIQPRGINSITRH